MSSKTRHTKQKQTQTEDSEKTFIVEAILSHKWCEKAKDWTYRIHWGGYPNSERSWILYDWFGSPQMPKLYNFINGLSEHSQHVQPRPEKWAHVPRSKNIRLIMIDNSALYTDPTRMCLFEEAEQLYYDEYGSDDDDEDDDSSDSDSNDSIVSTNVNSDTTTTTTTTSTIPSVTIPSVTSTPNITSNTSQQYFNINSLPPSPPFIPPPPTQRPKTLDITSTTPNDLKQPLSMLSRPFPRSLYDDDDEDDEIVLFPPLKRSSSFSSSPPTHSLHVEPKQPATTAPITTSPSSLSKQSLSDPDKLSILETNDNQVISPIVVPVNKQNATDTLPFKAVESHHSPFSLTALPNHESLSPSSLSSTIPHVVDSTITPSAPSPKIIAHGSIMRDLPLSDPLVQPPSDPPAILPSIAAPPSLPPTSSPSSRISLGKTKLNMFSKKKVLLAQPTYDSQNDDQDNPQQQQQHKDDNKNNNNNKTGSLISKPIIITPKNAKEPQREAIDMHTISQAKIVKNNNIQPDNSTQIGAMPNITASTPKKKVRLAVISEDDDDVAELQSKVHNKSLLNAEQSTLNKISGTKHHKIQRIYDDVDDDYTHTDDPILYDDHNNTNNNINTPSLVSSTAVLLPSLSSNNNPKNDNIDNNDHSIHVSSMNDNSHNCPVSSDNNKSSNSNHGWSSSSSSNSSTSHNVGDNMSNNNNMDTVTWKRSGSNDKSYSGGVENGSITSKRKRVVEQDSDCSIVNMSQRLSNTEPSPMLGPGRKKRKPSSMLLDPGDLTPSPPLVAKPLSPKPSSIRHTPIPVPPQNTSCDTLAPVQQHSNPLAPTKATVVDIVDLTSPPNSQQSIPSSKPIPIESTNLPDTRAPSPTTTRRSSATRGILDKPPSHRDPTDDQRQRSSIQILSAWQPPDITQPVLKKTNKNSVETIPDSVALPNITATTTTTNNNVSVNSSVTPQHSDKPSPPILHHNNTETTCSASDQPTAKQEDSRQPQQSPVQVPSVPTSTTTTTTTTTTTPAPTILIEPQAQNTVLAATLHPRTTIHIDDDDALPDLVQSHTPYHSQQSLDGIIPVQSNTAIQSSDIAPLSLPVVPIPPHLCSWFDPPAHLPLPYLENADDSPDTSHIEYNNDITLSPNIHKYDQNKYTLPSGITYPPLPTTTATTNYNYNGTSINDYPSITSAPLITPNLPANRSSISTHNTILQPPTTIHPVASINSSKTKHVSIIKPAAKEPGYLAKPTIVHESLRSEVTGRMHKILAIVWGHFKTKIVPSDAPKPAILQDANTIQYTPSQIYSIADRSFSKLQTLYLVRWRRASSKTPKSAVADDTWVPSHFLGDMAAQYDELCQERGCLVLYHVPNPAAPPRPQRANGRSRPPRNDSPVSSASQPLHLQPPPPRAVGRLSHEGRFPQHFNDEQSTGSRYYYDSTQQYSLSPNPDIQYQQQSSGIQFPRLSRDPRFDGHH